MRCDLPVGQTWCQRAACCCPPLPPSPLAPSPWMAFLGGGEMHPSLESPWALSPAPRWQNLGVAAGRTVRLALGHVLHGRQGSGNELKVILRSFGARNLLSSEKERKKLWGCVGWFHRDLCTWTSGIANPIFQGGCSDATAMDWASKGSRTPGLKVWMTMGIRWISALGRSRRHVNRLPTSCLVYHRSNLKPYPLSWLGGSDLGTPIIRYAFS